MHKSVGDGHPNRVYVTLAVYVTLEVYVTLAVYMTLAS